MYVIGRTKYGITGFIIEFYEDTNEDKPVEKFLLSLDVKMQAKLLGMLQILQEKKNQLREPYSKYLEDGIFELRTKNGTDITRVLYFFYYGRKIILTNGFVKKTQKTQKTPRKEILLAKRRKADYIERSKTHEIFK